MCNSIPCLARASTYETKPAGESHRAHAPGIALSSFRRARPIFGMMLDGAALPRLEGMPARIGFRRLPQMTPRAATRPAIPPISSGNRRTRKLVCAILPTIVPTARPADVASSSVSTIPWAVQPPSGRYATTRCGAPCRSAGLADPPLNDMTTVSASRTGENRPSAEPQYNDGITLSDDGVRCKWTPAGDRRLNWASQSFLRSLRGHSRFERSPVQSRAPFPFASFSC